MERPSGHRDLQVLIAALLVVLMPFPSVLATLMQRRGGYDYQALIFPSDVAVVGLVVLCIPDLVRHARRFSAPLAALAILVLILVVAFVVHPADRGFLNLLRYTGTLALAWIIGTSRDRTHRTLLVAAAVVAAAGQTVLALAQLVRESDLGLGGLGEFPNPFFTFGDDVLAPQGTMVHIYLLAGLALLTSSVAAGEWLRRPAARGWLLAAAVCVAPVAVTYSRAAAIGAAAFVAALLLGGALRRRREPVAAAGVLVAMLIAVAAIWPSGWTERLTSSSSGRRSVESLTTGRSTLMRQAGDLIRDEPLVGVGTGRYVLALRDRGVDPEESGGLYKPVHNVPLLAGAEGGLAALAAATALLVLLARRAWTAGVAGVAVYVGFLPYVLLDHFPYSFPQGIVMTGIWIGAIELFARDREDAARVRPAPAAPASGP